MPLFDVDVLANWSPQLQPGLRCDCKGRKKKKERGYRAAHNGAITRAARTVCSPEGAACDFHKQPCHVQYLAVNHGQCFNRLGLLFVVIHETRQDICVPLVLFRGVSLEQPLHGDARVLVNDRLLRCLTVFSHLHFNKSFSHDLVDGSRAIVGFRGGTNEGHNDTINWTATNMTSTQKARRARTQFTQGQTTACTISGMVSSTATVHSCLSAGNANIVMRNSHGSDGYTVQSRWRRKYVAVE